MQDLSLDKSLLRDKGIRMLRDKGIRMLRDKGTLPVKGTLRQALPTALNTLLPRLTPHYLHCSQHTTPSPHKTQLFTSTSMY